MTLKKAMETRGQKAQRLAAINATPELTDELRNEATTLMGEMTSLNAEIEERKAMESAVGAATAGVTMPFRPTSEVGTERRNAARIVRRNGQNMAFTAAAFNGDQRAADEAAYKSGLFLASLFTRGGSSELRRKCIDAGIEYASVYDRPGGETEIRAVGAVGAVEAVNTSAGYLVPVEMDSSIIRLVFQYGLARKACRIRTMGSDRRLINIRKGPLVAKPAAEADIATGQKVAYAQLELIARKWMTLAPYSNEINEDAIVSMADEIAVEMAIAFALAEDNAWINGDGTGTYNGIKGLWWGFDVNDDWPNMLTTCISGETTAAAVTHGSIMQALGTVPAFNGLNTKILCHPYTTNGVLYRLASGQKATLLDMIDGTQKKAYFGKEILESDLFYSTNASGHVILLCGDFAMGCEFGDRQTISIAVSTDRFFDSDQTAVRGVERFDIRNHNNLAASAVNATRNEAAVAAIRGPIVALKLA